MLKNELQAIISKPCDHLDSLHRDPAYIEAESDIESEKEDVDLN